MVTLVAGNSDLIEVEAAEERCRRRVSSQTVI